MKISINIDRALNDTEIQINCPSLTSETEKLIAALRMMDSKMTVIRDNEAYIIDITEIAYIESVDRKTFVYTEKDCYETKLKLYETEERLCGSGFVRVSKSTLVNLKFVRSLKAELDRRLRLTLENGEQLIVSRQYADEIKVQLGVK